MARILTVDPAQARGPRRLLFALFRRQYGGFIPGVFQVLMTDLKIGRAAGALYNRLHLSRSSPLSRLQREMLATVVNGAVGGAP